MLPRRDGLGVVLLSFSQSLITPKLDCVWFSLFLYSDPFGIFTLESMVHLLESLFLSRDDFGLYINTVELVVGLELLSSTV